VLVLGWLYQRLSITFQQLCWTTIYYLSFPDNSRADPELELTEGRAVLFACPAGFSSFCDFFLPKIGGPGPLGPYPRSTTEQCCLGSIYDSLKQSTKNVTILIFQLIDY